MEKLTQYLEQLNLSEIEAKLYITLLQNGVTSVKNLAQLIGIKRTTAYLYIDQLIEKGLIMKVVKGAQKQVAPTDLDGLEQLVKQKVETANILQKELPDIMQTIQNAFPLSPHTEEAEIKYYKGRLGVKKIYEEALKAKELRSYFNMELIKKSLPDNEEIFVHALNNNKNIKIFELLQDTPLSRKQLNASQTSNIDKSRYLYKFLPKGINLSAADILIFDNNVAIVTVSNQVSGVILKNSDYYRNSKELFDLIWKVLPENI